MSALDRGITLLTSPLPDHWRGYQFDGEERVDQGFHFTLTGTAKSYLDSEAILGQPCRWQITLFNQPPRVFEGIITSVEQTQTPDHHGFYHSTLEIGPWSEWLKRDQVNRSFANQSVLDIVQAVLSPFPFAHYQARVKASYPKIDFLTSFNENTWAFLTRLLASSGIHHYFTVTDSGLTWVLADSTSPLPMSETPYLVAASHPRLSTITGWRSQQRFGVAEQRGWRFDSSDPFAVPRLETSSTKVPGTTRLDQHAIQQEVPRFSRLSEQACPTNTSPLKLSAAATLARTADQAGQSTILALNLAEGFTLEGDSDAYRLLAIEHHCLDPNANPHREASKVIDATDSGDVQYHNTFTAIPLELPYVPPLPTLGLATRHPAVVAGKPGEAATVNERGEVAMRYRWQKDTDPVVWAGVLQSQSGDQWGSQWLPRAGDEISVVPFGGDLDRPVISHSLYSANQPSAIESPTQNGLQTRRLQSQDPTQGHRLRFDDTPGKEVLALHSVGDSKLSVAQDYQHTAQGSGTWTVDGDWLFEVLNGHTTMQANRITLSVGGNQLVMDDSGIQLKASAVHYKATGVGGSFPVARLGDDHTCPKTNSDDSDHKGGPVLSANGLVQTEGQATATVGKPLVCHGPNDTIVQGVSGITIQGKAIARKGSHTAHGGVITQGASTVRVSDANPDLLSLSGVGAAMNDATKIGPHWIQGVYHGAPKNLPWRYTHEDGRVESGVLDSEGKTPKITGLTQGSGTFEFGERAKLEAKREKLRAQLKAKLDAILSKERAQVKKDRQQLKKASWWDRWYNYGKGFVSGVADGVEGVGKGVVHLLEDGEEAAEWAGKMYMATETGDLAELQRLDQQATATGKRIIKETEQAYETLKALTLDTETHQILLHFAEDYYHASDRIVLLKDVGNTVGGILPALMIAIISKDPAALGVTMAAEAGGEITEAGTIVEEILETDEALAKCKSLEEAEVDKAHHVLARPEGVDEGAVRLKGKMPYPGYETKENLVHPSGEEFNLPKEEAANFSGEVTPKVLPPGTKLYRIIPNSSKRILKPYWSYSLPKNMQEWRSGSAVLEAWNSNGYYVEHTVGEGGLPVWVGKAASQTFEEEAGAPDWLYPGGDTQVYIPNVMNEVSPSLEIKPTLWKESE